MQTCPLRTTVIGSYPFPGWLEFAAAHLDQFGSDDVRELQEDAATAAVRDQLAAGLDVITDGEQGRLDFNLSFYGYIAGIDLESAPPRRWGPPAHDQRGKHDIVGELVRTARLGVVEEFERLRSVAADIVPEQCDAQSQRSRPVHARRSTQSERTVPRSLRHHGSPVAAGARRARALGRRGCREICVDEPSMSCYAHQEDTKRFVDIFNRTIEPIVGRTRVCMHMCFGNYKGRSIGSRAAGVHVPRFSAAPSRRNALGNGHAEFRAARADRADCQGGNRRGRGCDRREELLHRDARRRGRTDPCVPEIRTAGAIGLRS